MPVHIFEEVSDGLPFVQARFVLNNLISDAFGLFIAVGIAKDGWLASERPHGIGGLSDGSQWWWVEVVEGVVREAKPVAIRKEDTY